jgi:hypothetical protein
MNTYNQEVNSWHICCKGAKKIQAIELKDLELHNWWTHENMLIDFKKMNEKCFLNLEQMNWKCFLDLEQMT